MQNNKSLTAEELSVMREEIHALNDRFEFVRIRPEVLLEILSLAERSFRVSESINAVISDGKTGDITTGDVATALQIKIDQLRAAIGK